MKKLLVEIQKLSQKLITKWYVNGETSLEEGELSVLEIIKESMNPNNPNIEDCKDCIMTLKFLLKN
jgi:hypothetical protein